ncbi:MAG: hypothetical protein WCF90_07710 [Methanomicrobiales archaeon]
MARAWDSFPQIPEKIRGIRERAYNLWWNWHPLRHYYLGDFEEFRRSTASVACQNTPQVKDDAHIIAKKESL